MAVGNNAADTIRITDAIASVRVTGATTFIRTMALGDAATDTITINDDTGAGGTSAVVGASAVNEAVTLGDETETRSLLRVTM